MGPAFKTLLKVILGAVTTAIAAVLVDPANFVAFGALASVFAAAGALVASWLEKLAAGA